MSKNPVQYVASPMQGVLIGADGAPAANVPVRRTWAWAGKRGEDRATTDGNGTFSFGAVEAKRGFWGRLPSEDAIRQAFFANTGGEEVQFMSLTPRVGDLNHESDGAPFSVTCDLRKTPGHGGFWFGTCTLNSD